MFRDNFNELQMYSQNGYGFQVKKLIFSAQNNNVFAQRKEMSWKTGNVPDLIKYTVFKKNT